ncbi:MAG: hypothetical protein OXE84_04750 [Rhodobacteraceae bacterium]|nr:hypothetical protein [Paracoccaceae bacterium]MCY4196440.1 hypothetical protein [Paracoccaceae bacterium]MCY4327827.1 hypothetical protein [Paracoccaceae bacterium]
MDMETVPGVGVPVDDLRAMQWERIWIRIMAEITADLEAEDGRRAGAGIPVHPRHR